MSASAELTTWQCIVYILLWPLRRRPRNIIAWLAAIGISIFFLFMALRETVNGHITCDFAGQWMHGRAFYREECDKLYLIEAGKEWLAEGYTEPHLSEMIAQILKKGRDDFNPAGIEGPLYPPTACFFFSLLAPFTPSTAHAVAVYSYLLMVFACGWMISRITGGRLQMGEASLLVLVFPNNFMGLILGQNQLLTLTIIVAGWYAFSRGWRFTAGLVWALLAYKPVFAVALLLVPLALPCLRMLIGMGLGGLILIAATLPFTGGLEPWKRWMEVGQFAETIYRTDRNWVWMSRDLVGLPLRQMWDADSIGPQLRWNIGIWRPGARWGYFDKERNRWIFSPAVWLFWRDEFKEDLHQQVYLDDQGRSPWLNTMFGWCLLGTVAGGTILGGWAAARAAPRLPGGAVATGSRAIFLLTGGLLSVFHFMHYDMVAFALPVLIALAELPRWGWGRRAMMIVWTALLAACGYSYVYGDAILHIPWETFLFLFLWGWSGWMAWRDRQVQPM